VLRSERSEILSLFGINRLPERPAQPDVLAIEFYFTPELHLKDGRIIRDLEDAASFVREQEVRPRAFGAPQCGNWA
jgi:hypothetical protein